MLSMKEILIGIGDRLNNLVKDYQTVDPDFQAVDSQVKSRLTTLKGEIDASIYAQNTDLEKDQKDLAYEVQHEKFLTTTLKEKLTQYSNQLDVEFSIGFFNRKKLTRTSPLSNSINQICVDIDTKILLMQLNRLKHENQQQLVQSQQQLSLVQSQVKTLQQTNQQKDNQLLLTAKEAEANKLVLTNVLGQISDQEFQKLNNRIKGITFQKAPNGVLKWTMEFQDPKSYDLKIQKNKYLSDIVPDADYVKWNRLEGGKACFSFAMTYRRAAVATFLYRYFLKLQGDMVDGKSYKNSGKYQVERGTLDKHNFDMRLKISACLLYLFMEPNKDWQQIQADPHNPLKKLLQTAQEYDLDILKRKLAKLELVVTDNSQTIVPVNDAKKQKIDISSISDDLVLKEKNKTQAKYIGKYAAMFFDNNPDFQHKAFKSYCEGLYQGKEDQSDVSALQKLYAI